jgi:hypothetical protein
LLYQSRWEGNKGKRKGKEMGKSSFPAGGLIDQWAHSCLDVMHYKKLI